MAYDSIDNITPERIGFVFTRTEERLMRERNWARAQRTAGKWMDRAIKRRANGYDYARTGGQMSLSHDPLTRAYHLYVSAKFSVLKGTEGQVVYVRDEARLAV